MTKQPAKKTTEKPFIRSLFCPICGAKVEVKFADTTYPEVHRLPEHRPASNVNLCSGSVITVTIDFDRCSKCGRKMAKNLSGLCLRCFSAAVWNKVTEVKAKK